MGSASLPSRVLGRKIKKFGAFFSKLKIHFGAPLCPLAMSR